MDDYTSRQQIDELAELYLTGAVSESDQGPPQNPVEGPAPIRLSPKPSVNAGDPAAPTPQPPQDTAGGFDDSHPVLRLADSEEQEREERSMQFNDGGAATLETPVHQADDTNAVGEEGAPKAMLEAVLLGNLPGMSGPWLTQYAQLLAQTEGPVALLHVEDKAIDLELIEPRAEAQPAPNSAMTPVRIPPMRGSHTGLVGLLDAMVRSETTPVRTILVRIDGTTDALTLSRLAAMDDWTLLCGSDDMSIAGAAQSLRALVHADPRLADRSIGLMVMGSDEQAAHTAAGRIASDLGADLVNPVELIGHLKRMQPVQVREIGSFPDPVGIWPQLISWFDTLETPETQAAPEPAPATQPAAEQPAAQPEPEPQPRPDAAEQREQEQPVNTQQRLSPQAARLAKPASRPEPRPAFQPSFNQPSLGSQRATQPARRPKPAAAPQTQPEPTPRPKPAAAPAQATQPTRHAPAPRVLAPQPELDLVALLAQGTASLDDPTPLDARIPDQPNTQLAVDAQGVVHVLAHHGEDAQPDLRQAVMQVIEAGRWVSDNLELLALTQRDHAFIDQAPVLHLLTPRADLATPLAVKLAGTVRLHLLQQVQVGKATGWFCTPLG